MYHPFYSYQSLDSMGSWSHFCLKAKDRSTETFPVDYDYTRITQKIETREITEWAYVKQPILIARHTLIRMWSINATDLFKIFN